jgi:hypothetical protein
MIAKNSVELQDLLASVNQEEHFAYTALDGMDPDTRPAWERMQAQARDKLPALRTKLQNLISSRLVKVYVTGSQEHVDELMKMLETEVPVFTVKSLYVDVAEFVVPTLGTQQQISGASFLRLNEVLRKYAQAYRVMPSIPLPQVPSMAVGNLQELANVVRDVTRQAFGDQLNGAHIFHCATNEAIKQGFTKDVGAVVLTNMTKEERKGLNEIVFNGTPSIDVLLKTKPDKNTVVSIVKKLTENTLNEEE